MRKLILFIFLAAIFLGGYYLGRIPGSPDLFSWSQQVYGRVATATGEMIDSVRGSGDAVATDTPEQPQQTNFFHRTTSE